MAKTHSFVVTAYYKMLGGEIMPPSDGYLQIIAQGYRDFGLDMEPLEAAVR